MAKKEYVMVPVVVNWCALLALPLGFLLALALLLAQTNPQTKVTIDDGFWASLGYFGAVCLSGVIMLYGFATNHTEMVKMERAYLR